MNKFLSIMVALLPALSMGQDFQPASAADFPVIGTVPGVFPDTSIADNFCRRETGKCEAAGNQYKCGVFFLNLPNQKFPIRMLSNMPDVLSRPAVANSEEIRETFGEFKNVKPKSFRFSQNSLAERCSQDRIYNARCSVIMDKVSNTPLDSCTKTIFNDQGRDTIGNILCKHAFSFAGVLDPSYRIKIGYHYSLCESDWTPIISDLNTGAQKEHFEELCCNFADGKPTFQRCDGTPTVTTCPQ